MLPLPFSRQPARLTLLALACLSGHSAFAEEPMQLDSLQVSGVQMSEVEAAREELVCDLGMPGSATELERRLTVPFEAQPVEAFIDGLNGVLRRTLAIGILDAEEELALLLARIGPREQCRAGAADMQVAGGRRGEAGNDRSGHGGLGS